MSAPLNIDHSYPRIQIALNALADWIKRADCRGLADLEFHSLEPPDLQATARELGMSTQELRDVARQGRDAAAPLFKRMTALHLVPEEMTRAQSAVMYDLERLCSLCGSRGRCCRDLLRDPQDQVWKNYCPNAGTLEALKPQQ